MVCLLEVDRVDGVRVVGSSRFVRLSTSLIQIRYDHALDLNYGETNLFTDRHRLNNAPFNLKLGFSVVAPTSCIHPFSTYGKNKSCCALLNLCISSTNRIVLLPASLSADLAPSKIARTSAVPEDVAESSVNVASVCEASMRAMVVLPLPGGPHLGSTRQSRRRRRTIRRTYEDHTTRGARLHKTA